MANIVSREENAGIEHVLGWCSKNQPDVLCLQETKCVDEKFPSKRLGAIGFEHIAFYGEKSYNGELDGRSEAEVFDLLDRRTDALAKR